MDKAAAGFDIVSPVSTKELKALSKTVGKFFGLSDDAADATKATARGLDAEKRVLEDIGEVKNTKKVSSAEGNSVPDFQNKTTVGEIKDTKKVSNTRQIRIQRDAASASGREHVVITGKNTKVSQKVQDESKVRRRSDLGPRNE